MKEIYIILDNIRSAENVGSIFRTADAACVTKIFLTGITPSPIDRFGREQKKIAKTALGAEKTVSFEKREDITKLIQELRKNTIQIISVEQHENAVDYKGVKVKEKTAFIFGSETEGVSEETLINSDLIAEIPMHGEKESLNVAVSVGVFLYCVLDI